jgi:hypothetical protein
MIFEPGPRMATRGRRSFTSKSCPRVARIVSKPSWTLWEPRQGHRPAHRGFCRSVLGEAMGSDCEVHIRAVQAVSSSGRRDLPVVREVPLIRRMIVSSMVFVLDDRSNASANGPCVSKQLWWVRSLHGRCRPAPYGLRLGLLSVTHEG